MQPFHLARRELLKKLGLGAAFLPLLARDRGAGAGPARKKLILVLAIEGYRGRRNGGPRPARSRPGVAPSWPARAAPRRPDLPSDLRQPGAGSGQRRLRHRLLGPAGADRHRPYKEPDGKTLDQIVADGLADPRGASLLALGAQLERALPTSATRAGLADVLLAAAPAYRCCPRAIRRRRTGLFGAGATSDRRPSRGYVSSARACSTT